MSPVESMGLDHGSFQRDQIGVLGTVHGHFGPKTLRTQDILAHVFGAEVSQIFALVPKCLGHFDTKVHETLRTQN